MEQELVTKIKSLCSERRYDEALECIDQLENRRVAVEVQILCFDHELRHCDRSSGVFHSVIAGQTYQVEQARLGMK